MDMYDKLNELYEKRRRSKLGGGEQRIVQQHTKGKLTARERISYLLDAETFVELYPFITQRPIKNGELIVNHAYGDGVVTGYGKIDGEPVYIYAQDFTVMGGTLGEMHGKKIAAVLDLAAQNNSPFLGLIDSGGARIQEGVAALDGYGQIFRRNVRYSGVIPQISVILGPSAGGAVYSPAITDFVIMVQDTSQMFITGPKIIEQVTGEKITAERLGGAFIHNTKSGNAHFIAKTEKEALDIVRRLIPYMPSAQGRSSVLPFHYDSAKENDLMKIVPVESKTSYDVKQVIQSIVDQSSFLEVHAQFAKNIVVGFVRIGGKKVGIVANQPRYLAGSLDLDASDKAARFIRFCDAFQIPVVTLVDVTGFFPGVNQEHQGIIRHGAKLLYAYAEATVAKITIILRKAYGGAYVALSSKSIGADIVFAWPNAEIAVMGAEGAVSILYTKELTESKDPISLMKEKISTYKKRFATPYEAAELGLVDDVIDPRETRGKIIAALEMLKYKHVVSPVKKHGNIPL
ncbi:putative propionyl-CoA carboxylase beta chain [Virgibacillus pantothenticus]|uniref:Methylmalonyl-CoA carboxyltransferase n=1 Tax=Virgibacillus pantothenticus TaxID=1473 RepID=A0A0L0QPF5_VIRPA|nr:MULTISPECIES: acyl-CoA carboxylase subunit beta [Virgibacillus]API90480.1 methylmalonyl-CoA carboxyltransferase [Virgibacillus sp. 6R]KNE20441.1 methylmalonyl-CoA carboxyltransferase [Virgibacillus pantothenticus]MBS7429587.1 acyl-CoA carboxylase subunit beta [Virgibacillus sp. 19R1-5]MBU8565462.1 acyl-CoA carboxylase subunit beta [Virgibacillus pantothenticus]MBU8599762.1 acyl-CoA carboxylase subunit beta [Virgibacillus pantothenticus]